MTRDQSLLLMVAILGGVVGVLHVVRAFIRYVGERQLMWSWMAMYFLTPFVASEP